MGRDIIDTSKGCFFKCDFAWDYQKNQLLETETYSNWFELDCLLKFKIMRKLQEIKSKFADGHYEFSKHAVDQSIIRRISVVEISEAIALSDEIIEDYPEDKYGPSCLILGFTQSGRPLHIQCCYPSRPLLKIITVYEPDVDVWINHRVRRAGKRGLKSNERNYDWQKSNLYTWRRW